MEKITRADLARRRRIDLYKKIIIGLFFVMTITPMIISFFLLVKVHSLEKKLDYVMSGNGDYLTYRSSHDALMGNTENEDNSYLLEPSVKSVLGNAESETKLAENTGQQYIDSSATDNDVNTEVIETIEETGGKTSKKKNKRVYLTFDDGPSVYTGQILDILKANDVKATFFVIGKDEEYYDYYKRIVNEGHTLGMHSYTHDYQKLYASTESFGSEIEELQKLLLDVTGVKSNIFRFPGGSSNSVSQLSIDNYIAYLNEHGINYYDWNALSGDAVDSSLSPEQLVDNIMKDVRNNKDSVVLMHDLQTVHATVESLQMLIDTLKSEGYEILPIDENTPLIQHVSCNVVDE